MLSAATGRLTCSFYRTIYQITCFPSHIQCSNSMNKRTDSLKTLKLNALPHLPPTHFSTACDFELLVVLWVLTLCRTYVPSLLLVKIYFVSEWLVPRPWTCNNTATSPPSPIHHTNTHTHTHKTLKENYANSMLLQTDSSLILQIIQTLSIPHLLL